MILNGNSPECLTLMLKDQCVGFKGDLLAEMEYNIHNEVFMSV